MYGESLKGKMKIGRGFASCGPLREYGSQVLITCIQGGGQ